MWVCSVDALLHETCSVGYDEDYSEVIFKDLCLLQSVTVIRHIVNGVLAWFALNQCV